MDTLIGGPEPLYSRTPHRLDVPIKALVDAAEEIARIVLEECQ